VVEDLAGLGRAVEKFLGLVQSSVGTLYRPRAIRHEGQAKADIEAYKVVTVAKATVEARRISLEADQELAARAVVRLRHEELTKQENLESIINLTIPRIENSTIDDEVDKDWLFGFFESCASVSNTDIQDLWSKVLVEKVTRRSQLYPDSSRIRGSPLPNGAIRILPNG
jgi:Protein of unknown function (DUF2806)